MSDIDAFYLAATISVLLGNNLSEVDMRDAAVMFEPIVEVRDVLESYLVDQILVSDWREALTGASGQFSRLGELWTDREMADLGRRVDELAQRGLDRQRALMIAVAAEVENLLDQVRVPGVPRPEDEDWAF